MVKVANGTLLDFETATSHGITVVASDGFGGSSSASFTIAVSNVNPTAPSDSDGTANSVAEGAANGPDSANLTGAGSVDAFVSKLDSAGNFAWVKSISGSRQDQARAIAVDSSGNIYTTGWFSGTADFNPGAGTENHTSAGSSDLFILKLIQNQPPGIPEDNNSASDQVFEGAPNGTTVGITIFAIDPNGDTITYSLTDDAGGRFAINFSSGVISVADEDLLDGDSTHTITVQASDGAGGTSSTNFDIAVNTWRQTLPPSLPLFQR